MRSNVAIKAKPVFTAPMKETPATVRDVINVQSSLSILLSEEAVFMEKMQISNVGELQDRKLKMTGLLERYMRYLSNHPEVLAKTTADEKADLKKSTDVFNAAIRKNYNILLVARAVNGVIVKCVTDLAAKKDNNSVYNARGAMGISYSKPVSITINQTV